MLRSLPVNSISVRLTPTNLPSVFCRHKSLTAAIERGIRSTGASTSPRRYREDSTSRPSTREASFRDRTASSSRSAPREYPSSRENSFRDRTVSSARSTPREYSGAREGSFRDKTFLPGQDAPRTYNSPQFRDDTSKGHRNERVRHQESEERYPSKRDDGGHRRSQEDGEHRRSREERYSTKAEDRERPATREHRASTATGIKPFVPESLPYTTAASEFLYGYSVVVAALKGGRRKLYNLYVHTRGANHEGVTTILARARSAGVKIREVGDEYSRVLDKASSGRPHNGFILEASPLPQPPITQLGDSSVQKGSFMVALDRQTREDREVNGTRAHYPYKSSNWRHPFVLYVDGVLDEGNLGAIARSAYFLGVDAIATPTRQSAPWSQIALKASAGAAEAIPVFRVNKPSEFLAQSAQAGWRIYASDAIPPEEQPVVSSISSVETIADESSSKLIYTFARSSKRIPLPHHPVDKHPTILMMGAEGEGLRSSLLSQANYKVGIRGGRKVDEIGVDSLNVSVAASLLCYEFLQRPKDVRKKPGERLF